MFWFESEIGIPNGCLHNRCGTGGVTGADRVAQRGPKVVPRRLERSSTGRSVGPGVGPVSVLGHGDKVGEMAVTAQVNLAAVVESLLAVLAQRLE